MSENVFLKCSKIPYNLFPEPGVIANTTGNPTFKDAVFSSFQGIVTGTGAVTATFTIQWSNSDNINNIVWSATPLGTITLSGSTVASDGFFTQSSCRHVRAVLSNLTGTGATAQCYLVN